MVDILGQTRLRPPASGHQSTCSDVGASLASATRHAAVDRSGLPVQRFRPSNASGSSWNILFFHFTPAFDVFQVRSVVFILVKRNTFRFPFRNGSHENTSLCYEPLTCQFLSLLAGVFYFDRFVLFGKRKNYDWNIFKHQWE